MAAQVQIIEPYVPQGDKLSTAAYCRVSSNSADQLNSYRAQVTYYSKRIAENPDWVLADIYADEGITGTSMEKRDEFTRMIEDCRAGKINLILVKSVSRFARNTTELLEVVRELKELGVTIIFEEQDIDTSGMYSEMQLALFAMAAQEESRSISQNIQWSYRKRMENGSFLGNTAPYGYRLKNGVLEIELQEARIVQLIFVQYLAGNGKHQIVKLLNESDIIPPRGDLWKFSTVDYILSNERYTGNALLQKKYTVNALTHERRRNRGEVPKYYLEGSHEGIIPQETFDKVQKLLKQRDNTAGKKPHLFTHRITCGDCGGHYRYIESNGKAYWTCPKATNGLSGCHIYRLSEESIKAAFLNLAGKLYTYQDELLNPPLKLLREIAYSGSGEDKRLLDLNRQLAELSEKIARLQKLNSKGFIDAEDYRQQSDNLAVQRQRISQERKRKLQGNRALEMLQAIEHLQSKLDNWQEIPIEFSIELFDSIVEKIIPTDKHSLKFKLHCGLEFMEVVT